LCEKTSCDAPTKNQCCACSSSATFAAIQLANSVTAQVKSEIPSFLEVFHTMTHAAQNGAEQCCPCSTTSH